MTETQTPTTPPPEQPAGTPPPAPPPNDPVKLAEQNKRLLDERKKAEAKAKELEAKLAEAEPYLKKFKDAAGAEEIRAQREAEARAKQDAEVRAKQEADARRELAIARALIGLVPPGEDPDYFLWKLTNDTSIAFNPETGAVDGLEDAREKLRERFAKAGDRKTAPTPPDQKKATGSDAPTGKFATVNSLLQLQAMPVGDQMEFVRAHPDRYEALRVENRAGLARPLPPPPPPMAQPQQVPFAAPRR